MDMLLFLQARIAEDEDVVTQLERDMARANEPDLPDAYPVGVTTMGLSEDYGIYMSKVRLVAECKAKREFLSRHRFFQYVEDTGNGRGYCDHDSEAWPCNDLKAIAVVYADHPDFDPAWAV